MRDSTRTPKSERNGFVQFVLLFTLLIALGDPADARAGARIADDSFGEHEVRFRGGDVTLAGTVLVPAVRIPPRGRAGARLGTRPEGSAAA